MATQRFLLLVLLLFLPFDGTAMTRVSLGLVDVSVIDLIVAALFYVDVLDGLVRGFRIRPAAVAIGFWAAASVLLSVVSLLYIPSADPTLDIKLTLNLLELLVLVWISSRIDLDRKFLVLAMMVLLASLTILSLATWLKAAGFAIPGDVRVTARHHIGPFLVGVIGITSKGTSFSLALLAALPVVLVEGLVPSKIVRLVLGVLLSFAAVLTYSRSLWIAVAVELIVAATFSLLRRKPVAKLALGAMLAAGLVGIALRGSELVSFLVGLRPRTVLLRLVGYSFGWQLATADAGSLLFGAGKSVYAAALGDRQVPHNFLLELLISKGLLATLTFTIFLTLVISKLYALAKSTTDTHPVAQALLVGLLGMLVEGASSPILTALGFQLILALSVAVVATSIKPSFEASPNLAPIGATIAR